MINKNLQKKGLVFVTIALFFGISAIPAAGNIETENFPYAEDFSSGFQMTLNVDPYPMLEGVLGENDWYISSVWITFSYDPHQVVEIYYAIDGGNWVLYPEHPVEVSDDGMHMLEWYWVDDDGKQYTGTPVFFRIDKTAPTIVLKKFNVPLNKDKLRFEADVSDAASGVERVEFYLDDVLNETLMSPPYEWEYEKTDEDEHFVFAIVYNNAGLSEKSETLSTPLISSYDAMIFSKFILRIQSMVMWNQNVLKLIFYLFSSMMIHEK